MAAELDPEARDRLLDSLAAGVSISASARLAGYSRRYVHRLLLEARFAEELERRRAVAVAAPNSTANVKGAAKAKGLEVLALGVLEAIAKGGSSTEDRDRVAAAKELLRHARELAKPKPHVRAGVVPPELRLLPVRELPDFEADEKEATAWRKAQD